MEPAKMPNLDLNDLRIVLAVARGGTLAAAARALHVDQTTVARRLAAVEATIGATLCVRDENARRLMTEAGEAAVKAAERVEQCVNSLITSVTRANFKVAGTVRLTAVPVIVNHLLVPALGDLAGHHPRLQLELIAEPRDLSLVKREADLAIRLARPSNDAGAGIVTRRIGAVRYGIYVPATMNNETTAMLPWICYDTSMSALPQARWLAARQTSGISCVTMNDAEAIMRAIAVGFGRSLLPCAVADRNLDLRREELAGSPAIPSRDAWLLTHPDQRKLARVTAVVDWLFRTLKLAGIE